MRPRASRSDRKDIRPLRAIKKTCDDRDRSVSSVNTNYPMEPMQEQTAKSARTRILEAAAELFYREGIRAVGVDAVIAHSGVAKMSLYRNFAGKDELVAAFLEYRDGIYWTWWDKVVARHSGDPRAQIRAIFEAVGKRTSR